MGVPFEKIQETVRQFKPVEHRIEFVRERTGVRYYNDSKGTNPDAAIQALRAMPGPVLLIAGGYDKNSNYDEWVKEFAGRVKYLVLIGKTRDKIAACAKKIRFYRDHVCRRFKRGSPGVCCLCRHRRLCASERHVQAGICLKIMKNAGVFLKSASWRFRR